MMSDPAIEIVICTYDNASLLARTLESVAAQVVPQTVTWGCLVVQNNCTDGTDALVHRFSDSRRIAHFRTINEPQQGLTPARAAGVRNTRAAWVAFVDDDCALAPDWVVNVHELTARHPQAAAIGGEVVLDWEQDPPAWLGPYGYCFAEQRLGPDERPVPFLVGAGLVVRRQVLETVGWTRDQWVPDRIGRRLVSGGDVELVIRISATGHPLIYSPRLKLLHRVPAARTQRPYLARMHVGLGGSAAYADALKAPPETDWRRKALRATGRQSLAVLRTAGQVMRDVGRPVDVLMQAAFTAGYLRTATHLALIGHRKRRLLIAADVTPNSAVHPGTSGNIRADSQ